jgi:hypothetical protein
LCTNAKDVARAAALHAAVLKAIASGDEVAAANAARALVDYAEYYTPVSHCWADDILICVEPRLDNLPLIPLSVEMLFARERPLRAKRRHQLSRLRRPFTRRT